MMGSYCVYDSPYVEDILFDPNHDCMWSGQCYPCPEKDSLLAEVKEEEDELDVEGLDETCHMAHLLVQPPPPPPPPPIHQPTQTIIQQTVQQMPPSPRGDTLSPRPAQKAFTRKPKHPSAEVKKQRYKASEGKRQRQRRASSSEPTTKKQKHPTADSKKLRHREVEKNRHRFLQAMVKTLSERIPGRLDKETQVQTMKRAARYCVYLRDIANELSRVGGDPGSGSSTTLKGKLEKIYYLARDNVELLMSKK